MRIIGTVFPAVENYLKTLLSEPGIILQAAEDAVQVVQTLNQIGSKNYSESEIITLIGNQINSILAKTPLTAQELATIKTLEQLAENFDSTLKNIGSSSVTTTATSTETVAAS